MFFKAVLLCIIVKKNEQDRKGNLKKTTKEIMLSALTFVYMPRWNRWPEFIHAKCVVLVL